MATLSEMLSPLVDLGGPHANDSKGKEQPNSQHAKHKSSREADGAVDSLLKRSRAIVSELWTRYYSSRDATPQEDYARTASQPSKREYDPRVDPHAVLPTLLTQEKRDLQIDVRALKISLLKEVASDGKNTARLVIVNHKTKDAAQDCIAAWHMRFNLSELFESETSPG